MIAAFKKNSKDEFLKDVLEGFNANKKYVPFKYLYDEIGSQLFNNILNTPEYYVNRKENEILKIAMEELIQMIPEASVLIEIGSGDCQKICLLFDKTEKVKTFIPIDISGEILQQIGNKLSKKYKFLDIYPLISDFTKMKKIPQKYNPNCNPVIAFCLGITICNFDKPKVLEILKNLASILAPNGDLVISIDLLKNTKIIENAYNDKQKHTEKFNLNLLKRINNELNVNIPEKAFKYDCYFNEKKKRMEMYLKCIKNCTIKIENYSFDFKENETIHTENSYKYSTKEFADLMKQSGFSIKKIWTDKENYLAIIFASTTTA